MDTKQSRVKEGHSRAHVSMATILDGDSAFGGQVS
jgi:hypothetical protein